jgi:hypothetical protein
MAVVGQSYLSTPGTADVETWAAVPTPRPATLYEPSDKITIKNTTLAAQEQPCSSR